MSTFCKDCKHQTKRFLLDHECELTRRHYTEQDTGKKWSHADDCGYIRKHLLLYRECPQFEPKPTLIQRLKEVFS